MDIQLTNIDNAAGNDLTTLFNMRCRLASDPDVLASYTAVTTTQTIMGIVYPFFNSAAMPEGIYILHSYLTADGDTTGTKITVEVSVSGV